MKADIILKNGKIITLDHNNSVQTGLAIVSGKILATGNQLEAFVGPKTIIIDLKGKTVIPGLNDSHIHLIRGGLSYNMELRWDGVPSLADALRMLHTQVLRTPPPQWIRVIGGWSEFQFSERRMPTLSEINKISPDTPVFILHLYDRALLNQAALRAIGINHKSTDPLGGIIERDKNGNPTGMLIAAPNAMILYSALGKGPILGYEDQLNSTRQFMRELNRLGITSVIDAGGGSQSYPENYRVIKKLSEEKQLTVRIAYNLFTQHPNKEFEDFNKWIHEMKIGEGDEFLHLNGAGEMLVYSAADFEDFLQERPNLPYNMEAQLLPIIKILAEKRWPFRIHATYDESIRRILDVCDTVNREIPFNGLRWFIDHAETIKQDSMERLKRLSGGIAIQNRMGFQGEYFIDRYGKKLAKNSPPISQMLKMGIPVGAGTDATRVASYNPWLCLYWLVSGKTMGGLSLYPEDNRMDRVTALRLWTIGSSWLSNEDEKKGALIKDQFADLTVLSDDYFSIPEEEIKNIESVLTIVNGKIVYASNIFKSLSPPELPISPDWSPTKYYRFGGIT